MANLSNINNYFVVDTTGKVAIGDVSAATIPTLLTQLTLYDNTATASLVIQSGAASGKKYELGSSSTGKFQITDLDASVDRLTIGTAGNVGIGTTSPDSKLHVESTSATGANFILETTHSGGIPILDLKGAASAQIRYKDESNVIQGRVDFGDSGTFNFIDVPNNKSTLYLKTGGNVGIGTTSPDASLDIEPSSGDADILLTAGSQTLRLDQNSIRTTTNSNLTLFTNGNSGQLVLKQSNGNVGIGTTNPSYKLDIAGTSPRIRVQENSSNTAVTQVEVENSDGRGAMLGIGGSARTDILTNRGYINAQAATDGLAIGTESTDPIIFYTQGLAASNEKMRIDAKGLVKEIYNGATTTTSNYVRGTTYSWNGSSLSFYWNKIGNVNSSSGSCKLVVEVLGFGDNNYPYWQRGIIKVGKYSTGLNISVIRTEGFGGDLIGFDAVVDSNFDVWVKMNNLSWSSYIGFKLLNAEGGATLNTDPISSATLTTPTGGTPVVSADRSIRVNTGALGTITHSYQDFYTKIGGSNVFLLGPNQNTSFNITNIGNTSPTNPAQLNVKTPGSALVETGLRLINPYGFGSTGCGVKIAFAQDRSNGENYEMAAIESSQTTGGTSGFGNLSFYTRNNSALAERLRIQANGQSNFYGSIWATGYYITALQGNSQLTNASTSSGSLASYIGQGLISVSISDAKAKENFSDVQTNECLNKIVSLADHVKKFDWIDEDWKKQKGRTVGMVAQEIYEDHSEFVHKPENYDDDGWAIRYQEIVPTLIKSIQELKADNDSLKARIETLENN